MPSNNRDLATARSYHEATKHTFLSVRTGGHALDWANQPFPFKVYPELTPIPLPDELPQSGVAALSAVAQNVPFTVAAAPTLAQLAALLYFSAGITRRRKYPGGELFFRAAASTGALYQTELYVVCGELEGLAAGVYHFAPAEFGLRRLRLGDFRGVLAAATAHEPAVAHAPAIIVSSGIFWRNAWKYQARAYRHFGWDTGTLLANLLAMATAFGLPARVVVSFVDDAVNHLLGLNTTREVAFSLVPVGRGLTTANPVADVPRLELETLPLSASEVDYPEMRAMHEASALRAESEVRDWRQALPMPEPERAAGPMVSLPPPPEVELPRDTVEQVILRRGSARRFRREPITLPQFAIMLDRATRDIPADFHSEPGARINHLYAIVHAVDGLEPGAYVFHRRTLALELLKKGSFRSEARYLALEQELAGDASVAIFFMADLEAVFQRWGNRGYRAAQLEAGLIGGRLYLSAYAQRFGATGLTFYDDDVTSFFAPHANGKGAIFLTALGHSAKTAR
jgi:SagB-type dehydrogenase family enzyme